MLIAVTVAARSGADGPGLDTYVHPAVPYALFRWGSGREAVIGLGIILVAYVLGIASDYTGLVDAALASVVLLFPAALGAAVRYQDSPPGCAAGPGQAPRAGAAGARAARHRRPPRLGHRDPGAGRAGCRRLPSPAAVDALKVIEEASRTLAEMRGIVGVLREDEAGSPRSAGVADIKQLADRVGDRPRVEVHLSGDLDDLGPSVGAAVYRIAQESITNAVRTPATPPDQRVGRRRRRLRAPDRPRRRRCQLDRSALDRLRPGGHDRTGDAPRRRPRGRPGPRQGRRSTRCCHGGPGHMTIRVADDQEIVRTGLG